MNKLHVRLFWVFIFLLIWQLISLSGKVNPLIFPSITDILRAFYTSLVNGELISQTIYSLSLIVKGLFIGLAAASILSALSMISKTFNGFIETLTAIAHPLPGIALLPLIILYFGTGTDSIVFVIVHSVLWPMILNMLAGFRSVPEIYSEVGENYGLKTYSIIAQIMVPCSLPYLLTGIKIGWARAWRALISAEMIFGAVGEKGGLGWFIFKKRVFMDTAGMFAGLLVILIIGIIVEDLVFNKIEEVTVKKWGMAS